LRPVYQLQQFFGQKQTSVSFFHIFIYILKLLFSELPQSSKADDASDSSSGIEMSAKKTAATVPTISLKKVSTASTTKKEDKGGTSLGNGDKDNVIAGLKCL
jgi:hypothetical protein